MKKHFILVLTALFGLIGQNPVRADYPTGAVRGVFTVARGTQVVFSRGNLQYQASTGDWQFATNQYDIIGAGNANISDTYSGYIDLFGWGTGGTPTKTACSDCSTTFPIVGNDPENKGTWDSNRRRAAMEDDYNDFIDWGNNAITNGGNVPGQWRTLTADEWDYVIRLRDKAAMLFSLGKVAGVKGLILLPDEWTLPDNLTFVDAQSVGMDISQEGYFTNINESNFELNDYSVAQWQRMQNNGAVFLPAAGSRAETLCNNIGQYGYYWSSTADEAASAFSLSFTESIVAPRVTEPRASGQAVRLVADYSEGEEPTVEDAEVNTNMTYHPFTINADGGQISFSQGNLQYQAAPNKVFRFAGKQTDYIGEDNNKLKTNYTGWIDLMAYPTGNLNYRDYGPAFACAACVETGGEMSGDDDNGFDSPNRRNSPMSDDIPFTEFGDNTILNAGNYTWRTLTANEWGYLFLNRNDAADLFGFATVDNVRGVVILPDDWTLPSGSTFVPASEKMNITDGDVYELKEGESAYTLNTYSSTDMSWQKMEAAGAVFLPAAGYRKERVTAEWNESGFYLSSTEVPEKSSDILLLNFKQTTCQPNYSTTNWEYGYAVRLVRPYSPEGPVVETYTLTVTVNDAEAGNVEIKDMNDEPIDQPVEDLEAGDQVTLTAVEEYGFAFVRWEVTGTGCSVSDEESLTTTFTMGTSDATVTAHFKNILHTLDVVVPVAGGSVYINYGTAEQELYSGESLEEGEQVTMTVGDIQYGFAFDGWEYPESANVVENGNEITFKMDEEDVTITAHFKNILHTLDVVVVPVAGGSVYINYGTAEQELYSGESLEEGEQVTMTAVANDDYTFTGWSIGDEIVSTKFEYIFKMKTTDVTLKAKFSEIVDEPEPHILTIVINPAEGGSVGQEGVPFTEYTFEMQEGETKQMIATNATDYQFAGWEITEGDGTLSDLEDDVTTFTMGTTNTTVTAKFEELYRVTIGVSPEAGDNKVILGGVYTISDYMHLSVVKNAVLDLEAQTDANYVFVGWEQEIGDVTSIIGTDYILHYTVTENAAAIVAKYERLYTLNVIVYPEAGGVVKVNADDLAQASYKMKKGDTQTLIAEAAGDYTFTGWYIGDEIVSTEVEYTFPMGTTDVTLKAVFVAEHVHNWGEVTYAWSADNLQCTATRICLDDASHIETETVNATMTTEVTKEATCEEEGEETDTYTAIFENEVFGTQTKQIKRPIIALGHKSPVYTWSADYTTCTAVRECEHVAAHNISETVNATVTTVGGSLKIYTAVFTNQLFEEQEKTCVTMSEYGFLSLYADKAYIPTGGLTTIIYTGMEGRNLITQSLTLIPAYTGVFFIGEANKTYELVETITDVTYPENMLHGTLSDQPIPDNGQVHYILSRLESTNKGGLYWPANTNRGVGTFTNHAGKAYLEIPVSSGVAPRYFTMRGEACEEITAVGETQADGDGKYYDVLGREVREPQPQHIYIHNGQKVLYGE